MRLILSLLLGLLITVSTSCANNMVTVNLKVIDSETGLPVEGGTVGMGFLSNTKDNDFKGVTNDQGRVSATSDALWGVKIRVREHGYYNSTRRTARGDQDQNLLLRPNKTPKPK